MALAGGHCACAEAVPAVTRRHSSPQPVEKVYDYAIPKNNQPREFSDERPVAVIKLLLLLR